MTSEITLEKAAADDQPAIIRLLKAAGLPTEDLPANLENFIVARESGQIQGSVGLEVYTPYALLRSLAVEHSLRGKGVGKQLYQATMELAANQGVNTVYLITNTADLFFEKQGFIRVDRATVPDAIRTTAQFSGICPSSATLMMKPV